MSETWTEVKKELIGLAHAIDVPITENRVRWYVKVWQNLGPEKVLVGLRHWAMNAKVKRLPLPGEINFNISGDEVAGRIILAARKFGYMNATDAKQFLGEAWKVVEHMGGWQSVCESEWTTTKTAQTRDLWNQLQIRSDYGTHGQLSGHNEPQNQGVIPETRVGTLIRGIQSLQGPHFVNGPKNPPDGKS